MPLNDPNAKNASGLTPTESKNLKERAVELHEQPIIQGIKEVWSRGGPLSTELQDVQLRCSPRVIPTRQLYTCKPRNVTVTSSC